VTAPGRHRASGLRDGRTGRHRATSRRTRPALASASFTLVVVAAALGLISEDESSPAVTTKPAAAGTVDLPTVREPLDRLDRTEALSRSSSRTAPAAAEPSRSSRRPSRPVDEQWLEACASTPPAGESVNGSLPESALCHLPETSHELTKDAAHSWWRLSKAFSRRFGERPCITDSYRSLSTQQALRAAKPGLAAAPGTSNHGWGTALDLCGGAEVFGSEVQSWLLANASRWGWRNPEWAQQGGSKPEPWHWEFGL
jgi:zinc D-Ala-D-Ala carboxypeptidase